MLINVNNFLFNKTKYQYIVFLKIINTLYRY